MRVFRAVIAVLAALSLASCGRTISDALMVDAGPRSKPGLCTLHGKVSFPTPLPNQSLSVAALSPSALTAGVDPQTLLTAFGAGYRTSTNTTDTEYPYQILDLAPGTYLPVPALLGGTGISLNLLANLAGAVTCTSAGDDLTADFRFGQVSLSGTVEYTPSATASFAYGAIAAKGFQLSLGGASAQVILMPVLLTSDGALLTGSFSAQALKDNQQFEVRLFTNLDATAGNAFTEALAWALNPLAPEKGQASFTATPPSQTVTLKAP